MIKRTSNKNIFSDTWYYVKSKFILFKKWIIIAILGGSVLAAGIALTPDKIPFVMVNGERIEFPHTDENSNENFIIRTDKKTYGGWDKTIVYAMVENKSGIGQTINLQVFFSDNQKSMTSVSKLKQNIAYQITVDDYATSTYDCGYYEYANGSTTKNWIDKTCEKQEIVGTHPETRYKDEWQPRPILSFSKTENDLLIKTKNIPEKDKKGFVAEKKIEDLSLKNEISYFKIEIQFPRQTQGEFFLEIVGSEAGYGIFK